MTSFYLAGRFSRVEELLGVRDVLVATGHHVTSRWLDGDHQAEEDDIEAMRRFAQEDVDDILRADVLIAFTETPRTPSTNRGGRHVELGIALGVGPRIITTIVCGPYENAFTTMADVHVGTWAECARHIFATYDVPAVSR